MYIMPNFPGRIQLFLDDPRGNIMGNICRCSDCNTVPSIRNEQFHGHRRHGYGRYGRHHYHRQPYRYDYPYSYYQISWCPLCQRYHYPGMHGYGYGYL